MDLEIILKGQDRLEKKVNTMLGGHCSEGKIDKRFRFSIGSAHNHYYYQWRSEKRHL